MKHPTEPVKAFEFDQKLAASTVIQDQVNEWLSDAVDAAKRMTKGEDNEALHDFRVALRRLRSWLGLFPKLHGYSKKTIRALKALGRATNSARDFEVALDCARLLQTEDNPQPVEAALHLVKRSLKKCVANETKSVLSISRAQWERLLARLEEPALPAGKRALMPFADVYLAAIEGQLEQWDKAWAAPNLYQHIEDLHVLRIESKRLRYALEWWANQDDGIAALVKDLKGLQDTVGEHRDWSLLVAHTASLAAAQTDGVVLRAAHSASENNSADFLPPESLGQFIALAQRCGAKQAQLMARFAQSYDDAWRQQWRKRLVAIMAGHRPSAIAL